MQHRALFVAALLVACNRNQPISIPTTPPAGLGRAPGIPAAQLDALDGQAEAAPWPGVIAEARAVLRDPQFRDRLSKLAELDPGARAGESTTGREVATFLLGDAAMPSQVATQYLLTRDDPSCTRQTASTALVQTNTGNWFARTVLNPCSLQRGETPNTAAYACAINTAVHEMTHTVLDAQSHQLYQDAGHQHASGPLVSYTVGAVAQCVYLLRQGSLTDSMFTSCVNQVGTTSFNPDTCDDSWLLTLQGLHPDVHAP